MKHFKVKFEKQIDYIQTLQGRDLFPVVEIVNIYLYINNVYTFFV